MNANLVLFSSIWVLPLLMSLVLGVVRSEKVARGLAVATAATVLFLSSWALAKDVVTHTFSRTEAMWAPTLLGIRYHLGIDGLSAVVLPVAAVVVLAVLCASPRKVLTNSLCRQILLTESLLLGVLLSLDLSILTLFWITSLWPLFRELRKRKEYGAARMMGLMGGLSSLPMVILLVLLWVQKAKTGAASETPFDLAALAQRQLADPLPDVLGGLVIAGALIRMGSFPFHLWFLSLSERAPTPLTLTAFATPLGLFVMTRIPMPLFPGLFVRAVPLLLWLGLISATYGAALALVQTDLRRLLGYFWMSQQGFLLAGIAALNAPGVSGALIHALGTVVVRTGLALLIGSILLRAGTTDMRRLGGLVRTAPQMAAGFLLLSVAAVGAPATLGFVSEDLLTQGLLEHHEIAALVVLLTTALNGIVLFQAFSRVFLGEAVATFSRPHAFLDLLPRERFVAVALFGMLLVGGLVPAPLLAVRTSVVEALHAIDKEKSPIDNLHGTPAHSDSRSSDVDHDQVKQRAAASTHTGHS
ncbi:MAG TPA: proton-conducting transporter membrane subunit [Pseudomonadota bacterium]|jgi:NADH-quinone oxidoreductase subunit M|nr:proton-conducting transporter membrane subunit [Pseudomonadota bacterium]